MGINFAWWKKKVDYGKVELSPFDWKPGSEQSVFKTRITKWKSNYVADETLSIVSAILNIHIQINSTSPKT